MERLPFPLDEAGLPYIPERYFDFDDEVTNTHHLYFYKKLYVGVSAVHHTFRNMHTQVMPIDGHNLLHRELQPPEVPTYDFMAGFIIASEVPMSNKLRKELKGWRHGKRSYC